jgi:hypothetical protein
MAILIFNIITIISNEYLSIDSLTCGRGYKKDPSNPNKCIEIIDCYISCSLCTAEGNPTTHNCSTCAEGYFPTDNDPSMCYKSSSKVNGYYYDTLQFKRCNIACRTCTGPASQTSTNCETCNDSYSAYANDHTNCLPRQNGMGGGFDICYPLCSTCKYKGNDLDHMCTSCIDGFSLVYMEGRSMCKGSRNIDTRSYKLSHLATLLCLFFIFL